jgi:hypothetical protein
MGKGDGTRVFLDIDIGDAEAHAKEQLEYETSEKFLGAVGEQVRLDASEARSSILAPVWLTMQMYVSLSPPKRINK